MKINTFEITTKAKPINGKKNHPNMLAIASVTLKEDLGEYLTITGFTIWKSLHQGYNVEVPQSVRAGKKFKYCQGTLLARIKQEIIKEYERDSKLWDIPVVEDNK